jgi:hypothetical protein
MSKQYCVDCEDFTEHIPKLSAIMGGHLVCDTCHVMNGFCTLTKPDQPSFRKGSKNVLWIEWDENSKGKATHKNPQIGFSLVMSPFNGSFTWQTTAVTELIQYGESFVHFKTENSEYKLYINREAIKEFVDKND